LYIYELYSYNKTNEMHLFLIFWGEWNSTCFGQSLFLSSGVQHCTHSNWYMSYTAPVFLKLNLLQQLIVKNLCPKFHENLTGVSVADSRPRTEGCGLHIWHSVLPHKKCQKRFCMSVKLIVCVAYFGIPKW